MYIKLKKYSKNTPLGIEDFKLQEFSLDLDRFVADTELSCNKIDTTRSMTIDDSLSFLVKFKAEYRGDPREVKSKVEGYLLPDNLSYTHEPVEGTHFRTVGENHYELKTSKEEIEKIATGTFNSAPISHNPTQVKDYIFQIQGEKEWIALFNRSDRKKWRSYLKNILGEYYFRDHGNPDLHTIKKALKADPEKAKPLLEKLIEYGFFKDNVKILIEEEIKNIK